MRKFPIFALLLVACGGSGSETPPPAEPTSTLQAGGGLQTIRRSEVDPTYESTPEFPARTPVPTGNPASKRGGGRGRR